MNAMVAQRCLGMRRWGLCDIYYVAFSTIQCIRVPKGSLSEGPADIEYTEPALAFPLMLAHIDSLGSDAWHTLTPDR